MILRKPYAFLIKNFKKIHAFLLAILVYVTYRTKVLLDFINKYRDGFRISIFDSPQEEYIGILIFFIILLTIAINAVIWYLLKRKEKSRTFYLFNMVFYALLFVLFAVCSYALMEMTQTTLDTRFVGILRDLLSTMYYIQFFSILVTFVRTVGFNVKKFDFQKDLIELDIDAEDNEEFEVEFGLDAEDIHAKIRRTLRFAKYIYYENKIFFIPIFVAIAALGIFQVGKFVTGIEHIYSEDEIFSTHYFEISVDESYKLKSSTADSSGGKYFYLLVRLNVKNKSSEARSVNFDNIRTKVLEYVSFDPTTKKYETFADFGQGYWGEKIPSGESTNILLVFEIDEKYYNYDCRFEYLVDVTDSSDGIHYNYKKVKLEPQTFKEAELVESAPVSLGEKLVFEDSILKNTTLQINQVEFGNKYQYQRNWCIRNKCNTNVGFITAKGVTGVDSTLMKISYDLQYDESLGKDFNIKNFIAKYSKIVFVKNGNEYKVSAALKDHTPFDMTNEALVEVSDRVTIADVVYLEFTIRDKKYRYKIVDNPVEPEEDFEDIEVEDAEAPDEE